MNSKDVLKLSGAGLSAVSYVGAANYIERQHEAEKWIKEAEENALKKAFTVDEENLIKDILHELATNKECALKTSALIRLRAGLGKPLYEKMCDSIFNKLGNGRVTVVEG